MYICNICNKTCFESDDKITDRKVPSTATSPLLLSVHKFKQQADIEGGRGHLISQFGQRITVYTPFPEQGTCIITQWPVQKRKEQQWRMACCSIYVCVRFTVSAGFSLSVGSSLFMSQFVHNSWQGLHSPHSPTQSGCFCFTVGLYSSIILLYCHLISI